MSRRARRHGKGGRTGQHHSKTPHLRSYVVPPAGPVTITRADGTVETVAPQKALRDAPKPRRKATKKARPAPPMPTARQLLTVHCPSCGRTAGEPCTVRQGHAARVEVYRAKRAGTPADAVDQVVKKGIEQRIARRNVTPEEREKRAAQSAAAKAAGKQPNRM